MRTGLSVLPPWQINFGVAKKHTEVNHESLLFNEEESRVTAQVDLSARGRREWLDPFTAAATPAPSEEPVVFQPHQFKVLTAAVLNPRE